MVNDKIITFDKKWIYIFLLMNLIKFRYIQVIDKKITTKKY